MKANSQSFGALHQRQRLYQYVRTFFAARAVREVETPIFARAGNTDPAIESLLCHDQGELWARTSPEFFHKRLLAAGFGDLFEIAKVFRRGERSRRHRVEFTLLEYYRLGFDEFALMAELAELISTVCVQFDRPAPPVRQLSYRDWFVERLALDPFSVSLEVLQQRTAALGVVGNHARDDCLDLLRTHLLEPGLDPAVAHFVYDFPASQAALAQLSDDGLCGRRFELFFGGFELANGYFELRDAAEQHRRFENDLRLRQNAGQTAVPVDHGLLEALAAGVPVCAGVAMGLDRLLLVLLGLDDLAALSPFSDD